MRMSSFIFGGIVGAATAIYLNRNNTPLIFTLGQAGESVNKMMDTAKSKLNEMKTKQSSQLTNTDSSESLDDVRQMAEQDPQVKQQIDEIMENNGGSSYHTQ